MNIGVGELEVVKDDERALAADVIDHGRGMAVPDPIPRPAPDALRGRGLWLSQLMTDRTRIRSDGDGTVVHLEMDLGKHENGGQSPA